MVKLLIAINSIKKYDELKKEKLFEIKYKNIFYKEGILEILNKNNDFNYLILDGNLSGEVELNILIEKIFKINKKLNIILLINNKNIINNIKNKEKIKIIYYTKKINIEIIKKYILNNNYDLLKNKEINNEIKNYYKEQNNNKIIKKNKNKIIFIYGDRKIGKSVIIINFIYYLIDKNYKTLIIEELNNNIIDILNYKKNNKNNNVEIISENRIIDNNYLNNIKNNYDFIIIEKKEINNDLLNKNFENILVINPNLLEIKNNKKIIENNYKNNKNKFKIIINKNNKYSINKNIIKNIYNNSTIIGVINYKNEYERLINSNKKNKIFNSIFFDKEIFNISKKIFN